MTKPDEIKKWVGVEAQSEWATQVADWTWHHRCCRIQEWRFAESIDQLKKYSMNAQAEYFFETSKKWNEEYNVLRTIVLANKSLEEDFKWMHPCYTYQGKNVVLIHGFKDYCALLFHKGALLTDGEGLLIQQTENVQSARQLRFTSAEQIKGQESIIKAYINEAIELEKAGKKVMLKSASAYPVPEEFQKALQENEELSKAFYSLTPGRQKGYLFYFNQAKQSKTREARIEKYYQKILDGNGIDD